jgi:hypothetical protein
MAIDAHVHRFSTAEYERMVNSGVLGELAGVDGIDTTTVADLLTL